MLKRTMLMVGLTSLLNIACAQGLSSRLTVSDFMMIPKAAWAPIAVSQSARVTVTEELAAAGDLGFRLIHLDRAVRSTKVAARDLAASGLIQPGDILLSFRPEWDGTLAYAHMQLGVSHSGFAFIVEDETGTRHVHTLESPLNYSSYLDSPHHYTSLDAIHVLRPNLSNLQMANLSAWARTILLANKTQFEFFADYGKPMYLRGLPGVRSPADQVDFFARAVTNGGKVESYCSEFVWMLLSLKNCDPKAYTRACIAFPFATTSGALTAIVPAMTGNAGLAQGPEAALTTAGRAKQAVLETLTQRVFVDILTDPEQLEGRMSAGHRAVAEANRESMLLINAKYYMNGEDRNVATAINSQVAENFSPTSFLLRASARLDGFSYVGTVVFDK